MKKLLSSVVVASAFILPMIAMGETTASSQSAQIQSLLAQIQTLQTQIQALKDAQAKLSEAQNSVTQTLSLIRNLKQGMTGDDVSALQAVLASDPSIYPEGRITGFFGNLTSEAVKKFQKKHNLESVGFVGPKTLEKLKEEKEKFGIFQEENQVGNTTEERGKRPCTIAPPGHMIAPGFLKKQEDNDDDDDKEEMMRRNGTSTIPMLPQCKRLPPGIDKKIQEDIVEYWKWNATNTIPMFKGVPDNKNIEDFRRLPPEWYEGKSSPANTGPGVTGGGSTPNQER